MVWFLVRYITWKNQGNKCQCTILPTSFYFIVVLIYSMYWDLLFCLFCGHIDHYFNYMYFYSFLWCVREVGLPSNDKMQNVLLRKMKNKLTSLSFVCEIQLFVLNIFTILYYKDFSGCKGLYYLVSFWLSYVFKILKTFFHFSFW